jgi:hypothetical protein
LAVLKERLEAKGLFDQVNHAAAKAACSVATPPSRRIGEEASRGAQSETLVASRGWSSACPPREFPGPGSPPGWGPTFAIGGLPRSTGRAFEAGPHTHCRPRHAVSCPARRAGTTRRRRGDGVAPAPSDSWRQGRPTLDISPDRTVDARATGVWRSADWEEREVFDLFGISGAIPIFAGC